MEGANSDIFSHFKYLLYTGLVYLRKYKVQIMGLLDIMKECPGMKCFSYFDRKGLEKRFHESCNDKQLEDVVSQLVNQSINSYSTGNYDRYQWITNEIHS
jgi:phosphatidylinositol 4-kinase